MFNRLENLKKIEEAWKNQPYKVVDNQLSDFEDFKSKLNSFLLTAPHFFLLFNFSEGIVYKTTPGINQLFGIEDIGFSIDTLLGLMHPEDVVPFIESEKAAMEFWKTNIPLNLWQSYRHQVNFRVKYKEVYRHILMQSITVDIEENGGVRNKLVCFTDYSCIKNEINFEMEVHAISLSEQNQSFYAITKDALKKVEETLSPSINLSAREHDVLSLISYGKSSKEISDILHLSKNTVDNHRKNMILKNPVSSIHELIRYAIKGNMI